MQSRENTVRCLCAFSFTWLAHVDVVSKFLIHLFIITIVTTAPCCLSLLAHLTILCAFQIMALDPLLTSTAYARGTVCKPLHIGTGPEFWLTYLRTTDRRVLSTSRAISSKRSRKYCQHGRRSTVTSTATSSVQRISADCMKHKDPHTRASRHPIHASLYGERRLYAIICRY